MNLPHLQPTGCRLGLPTWRSYLRCQTWVRVKAGKTTMHRHRHLINPFYHPSGHTFDPRVKSGQSGSNQKMNFWHLQPAGCRSGLPPRRPGLRRPALDRVKAGKTRMLGYRHLVSPITHPSEHTFDPRVKPGQSGSNQKMNFWHLQPAGCRLGLLTRRPCLSCQDWDRVKAGKTTMHRHRHLINPFYHPFCAFPFDLFSRIYRAHSCFQC